MRHRHRRANRSFHGGPDGALGAGVAIRADNASVGLFELTKKGDDILPKGSPVAARLELGSELPSPGGGGVALH
jgi:hypothetical protein